MTDQPIPKGDSAAVPWLTTEQMVEVDRIMIDELGIELKQMMENAGRNLAQLVLQLHAPTNVVVLAGSGGNGGGGLVAARHLANHGVQVQVVLSREPNAIGGVPALQLAILERMGLAIATADTAALATSDVIVDAIIGYSLGGAPRGVALDLIDAANHAQVPIVSLDVPSGIDSSTGHAPGSAVTADATLTLAAPKHGLRDNAHVGRLFVGDIAVPPSVYDQMGLVPPTIFHGGQWLIELDR